MAMENRIRIGRHLDLYFLSQPVGWRIGLDDVGDHPHRGEIGDRVRCWRVARLSQKPWSRITRDDPSRNRARHQQGGVEFPLREDLLDFGIGLSEYPDRILGRLEVAFRGLL